MNYEKKYKEALECAKSALDCLADEYICNHVTKDDIRGMYAKLFPELKESEDEKIRKSLIILLQHFCKGYRVSGLDFPVSYKDMLAWLEKQGTPAKLSEEEQNKFANGVLTSCALSFIDYLDTHKYEGKMCVSNGECEDIENAFHNAMWDRLHRYYCKYIEKQGEQKPAEWSKEDETMTTNTIIMLKEGASLHFNKNDITKAVNWLKSLRPQNTWKPSSTDIQVLEDVIDRGINPINYHATLHAILEQLKKLREE